MPRLILMRHAQPQPHHPDGDKARELDSTGRADAERIGDELAGRAVDYALVSSATRTRQTFEGLGLDVPAEFQDALYNGDTDTMLQRIGETGDDVDCLLVIGHAPTVPHLASMLASAATPKEADSMLCAFPTGAYQEFAFDGTWASLAEDPEGTNITLAL